MHTLRNIFNYDLNRLFLSTFKDSFFGISNDSFVGKVRARRVVVGTELCRHFLVAHKVGFNFLRIMIIGRYRLNWRDAKIFWRMRKHVHFLFKRNRFRFDEIIQSSRPLLWKWRYRRYVVEFERNIALRL